MLPCDGLTGHIWEDLLTSAGNGINRVKNRDHDGWKLQEGKTKTKENELSQHYLCNTINICACLFDGKPAHKYRIVDGRFDLCSSLITTLSQHHSGQILCLRRKTAHLLVSPRQQHTGVPAKSLILIFYEGTQHHAQEYLPSKSTAYYINYSVSK